MSDIGAITLTVWRALADSVRLAVREERWFVVDVLGGVAAYAIWVAGTAALGMQVATLAEYEVTPGGTPTDRVLALVAILWLALPAIAGAAHYRSRIVNIRGNVERQYRVDRPGMLLAAPVTAVVVLALGTVFASGFLGPVLLVLLLPASLFLLVRTAAFSYRVYAFSHPTLVHVATVLGLFVQAGVALAYLGLAVGQGALAEAAVATAGIDGLFAARADLLFATRPALIVVAVLVPIVLSSAYVTAQRIAVAVARRRDDEVAPASLRTGQRYPPWWDVERAGMTPSVRGGRSATDGAGTSTASGGVTADADGPPGDDGDADTRGEESSSTAGNQSAEPVEESPGEDASHTRVYTPPNSELGAPTGPERDASEEPTESGDDATVEPDDGDEGSGRTDDSAGGPNGSPADPQEDEPSQTGADTRDRPGTADEGDRRPGTDDQPGDGDDGVTQEPTAVVEDGRRCWSCDTALPEDTQVNYCPQCGERIL